MSSLYSYIMTSDTGFAPNPFFGVCTLACCKPVIRRTAGPGDWIVGLQPKKLGNGLVYAMHVAEKLAFADYWAHLRFQRKRADFGPASGPVTRRGDNVYEPLPDGAFRQRPCRHAQRDGSENPRTKQHDLGGRYVLVADRFVYFGQAAQPLPPRFAWLIAGRGHRRFPLAGAAEELVAYLEGLPQGVLGPPRQWPAPDASWRQEEPSA